MPRLPCFSLLINTDDNFFSKLFTSSSVFHVPPETLAFSPYPGSFERLCSSVASRIIDREVLGSNPGGRIFFFQWIIGFFVGLWAVP